MDYLIVNGKVISKAELNLTDFYVEKTFQLEQTIWFGYGSIPLLSKNVDYLLEQIKMLRLAVPSVLKNKRELFRITKRMLNKNKFYRSGLLRFDFFWNSSKVNSVITSSAFKQFDFPLRSEGILLNFSTHKLYSENNFNRFPFYHFTKWEALKRENESSPFHNSILLNEKGHVCECTKSNIFFITEKSLITPALNSGCYEDILRSLVLETAAELELKVEERSEIELRTLPKMDEIFIAGEETGLQWVLGIENKRYIHQYVDVIHKEINEKLRNRAD